MESHAWLPSPKGEAASIGGLAAIGSYRESGIGLFPTAVAQFNFRGGLI
jgi:hypothetical protein